MTPRTTPAASLPPHRVELNASFKRLLAVNVAAVGAGAALLAIAIAVRPGLTQRWFPLLFALSVLYLLGDTLYWLWRGVHRVVLERGVLNVYRGLALRHEAISVSRITDVHLHRRLTRRSLQVLLGSHVARVPGLTLYPGPKIWIVSDAFELSQFDELVEAVVPHAYVP